MNNKALHFCCAGLLFGFLLSAALGVFPCCSADAKWKFLPQTEQVDRETVHHAPFFFFAHELAKWHLDRKGKICYYAYIRQVRRLLLRTAGKTFGSPYLPKG